MGGRSGLTEAALLKVGDMLKLENGKTLPVEKIEFEQLTETVKVYNFEVEDFHTYYVGENSILVHNADYYEERYTSDGGIYSRIWYYSSGGSTTIHYTHVHDGAQPHIHHYEPNKYGYLQRTSWDMNGRQLHK